MNNAMAPSFSPDVLERVLHEILGEEGERGMEERLAIVFSTGPLNQFFGSPFQQDFADFVRILYAGEERWTYELWRRRAGNNVTALHLAAHLGHSRLCQVLIQSFLYDINAPGFEEGDIPLHFATVENHITTVESLIDLGANVNIKGQMQNTPLHIAVTRGYEELVRVLISRGADPETSSIMGTPLQCAAAASQHGTLQVLLDNNVEVNSTSRNCSLTPLHLAVEQNSMECVRLLLKAEADAVTGACGTTPICHAAYHGTTEMVACLLKGGADPDILDEYGATALENAILADKIDSARILFPCTLTFSTLDGLNLTRVIEDVNSLDYMMKRNSERKQVFKSSKTKGDLAFMAQEYFNAVHWYAVAVSADPSDATVYSSRSKCYAHLFKGDKALHDAQQCVRLRTNWAEAYYNEGVAWKLLKDRCKALEALHTALKLETGNVRIEKMIQSIGEEMLLREDRRG